ncbi:MAG: hypothetical protein QNJ46_01860 [Leptolyngbyaceae cyanobacterium MO_188.B28]|nr:hypothetical protein [Leptolyngbyaceae cyanobacterium MO_188.B28]
MSYSTGNPNELLSPYGELIPSEVKVRLERAGGQLLRKAPAAGSTVDREGFLNNYAVVPQMSYAAGDTPKQQQQLGAIYAAATWGLVALAAAVTYASLSV